MILPSISSSLGLWQELKLELARAKQGRPMPGVPQCGSLDPASHGLCTVNVGWVYITLLR